MSTGASRVSLGEEYGHAAARWARATVGILGAPTDPTTVAAWGRRIGVSTGALRAWCRAAGMRGKASLDFARMLRAVVHARERGWDPQNVLDVVDDRTLKKLLTQSGFTARWMPSGARPPNAFSKRNASCGCRRICARSSSS